VTDTKMGHLSLWITSIPLIYAHKWERGRNRFKWKLVIELRTDRENE